MTAGTLAGLRVLDAASLFAAPLLSALLADHGADVVLLEPPEGDSYRTTPFWPLTARGKRSVVLDSEDRATLHRLVAAADVVVVNEPAARLARRGLDPATLLAVNPDLVVAHVSGFGADGPYADRPGNGTLAEAFAGLTHMTGDADGPPVLPSVPLGDAVMALTGAFGVVSACYDLVANSARGRVVDVNPVDAMLHIVGPTVTAVSDGVPPPGRLGSRLAGSSLRMVFSTADGAWVATSISTPRQRRDLAALVGAPDDAELEHAVRAWFEGHDRDEAIGKMVAAMLPVAPVNTARDVAADPHIWARGALRALHTHDGRTVTVPAPAPRTAGAERPASVEVLAATGEHTAEVLAEWTTRPAPPLARDDSG
ncbi:CaiB/BaiF CoA transferase family protein [Parafrankia sp. FMc2]|uniref:CaiB/BaiF CoA transferase family protein n=1 Tax=Parafrankia sp. FMc2 TaxID=3233196 RepID=UPI0034D6C701